MHDKIEEDRIRYLLKAIQDITNYWYKLTNPKVTIAVKVTIKDEKETKQYSIDDINNDQWTRWYINT